MDPVTHVLFSCALARAELIPGSREAQAIMIVAALAPDLDHLFRLRGLNQYFIHHRRETHSLLGLLVLSLPLVLLGRLFSPELSYPRIYLFVVMGLFSHFFLDFLSVPGLPFWFPGKKRFYNFGILFFLDPWPDLLLLPAIFEKIIPLARPQPARIALSAVLAYLVFLALLKMAARVKGRKSFSEILPQAGTARIFVSPFLAFPFTWLLLMKHGHTVYRMRYSFLSGPGPVSLFKSDTSSRLGEAVEKSPLIRALANFSDFIFWRALENESGYRVLVHDLRFSQFTPGFRAEAEFSPEGNLVSERFRYF